MRCCLPSLLRVQIILLDVAANVSVWSRFTTDYSTLKIERERVRTYQRHDFDNQRTHARTLGFRPGGAAKLSPAWMDSLSLFPPTCYFFFYLHHRCCRHHPLACRFLRRWTDLQRGNKAAPFSIYDCDGICECFNLAEIMLNLLDTN